MQDEDEEEEIPRTSRSNVLDIDEEDDDDDEEVYNTGDGFTCHAVVADGLPKGPGIPTEVCPTHCTLTCIAAK